MLKDFLEKTLKRRFVKCVEWPPSSPDVNPLDYFFWDLVKTKVYQGRAGEPFSSEEELKTKIKAVWKDCATDLKPLRKTIKQFVPRYPFYWCRVQMKKKKKKKKRISKKEN